MFEANFTALNLSNNELLLCYPCSLQLCGFCVSYIVFDGQWS